MRQSHLPPGIEKQAHEAILALASCNGLEHAHVRTIQYCIAVCPEEFHRAYEAYFSAVDASGNTERLNLHLDQPHSHRPGSDDGRSHHS